MDGSTPTDDGDSVPVLGEDRVRSFTPKLIKSKPEELPEDVKHKTEMIGFLSEILDDIAEDKVAGLIIVMVFKDGSQSEVAVTQESDYAILGRMQVAADSIKNSIIYDDESEDD